MRKDKRWSHNWFDFNNKRNLKKRVKVKVCGICLEKPKNKELHHIEYYDDSGSDDPENLCWLCKECHKKLHRWDGNLYKKTKWGKKLKKLKREGII